MIEILLSRSYYFRKQVVSGRLEAERDGVVVPLTLEDYCKVSSTARSSTSAAAMDSDFYVEDYDLDVESDANSEDEYQDDATDSGNGES
jgi:ubiquitin-conjugating enzyme E2 R